MQPEILTRCSSCGAAVREPGMFCPECGKPMTTAAQTESAAAPEIEQASSTEMTADEPAALTAERTSREAIELAVAAPQTTVTTDADKSSEPVIPQGARERTRDRLHRASNVARGAIEDNVKRVEKIHHVSTAMIEEAHYDSSLRFVLVAVGLFIVFIILLVLSKVMG